MFWNWRITRNETQAALCAVKRNAMELIPLDLDVANEFVGRRHHRPVVGHKFSLGVQVGGDLCGVAIIGRPVSRMLDDGWTLEVTRCCTDGTPNVCSKLYRAAWRAVQSLGFRRLVTYTLKDEGGASMRGAGFRLVGNAGGGSWSRPNRLRIDKHPLQEKLRWDLCHTTK